MRRHREELKVFAEMNLTNMLDTAFVLLLAFMLVAPMIKHGVEIEIPYAADARALSSDDPDGKSLTIAIGPSLGEGLPDRLYIEDRRVSIEEMKQAVIERKNLYPELAVMVEADRRSSAETLIQVVAGLKNTGIEGVSMPTDPVPFRERPAAEPTPQP